MTEHVYEPGQRVTVPAGDHPRYYIGMTRDGLVVTETEDSDIWTLTPSVVATYVEPAKPAEIPDGWELIRSDKLEEGVHEVYNPDRYYPWMEAGVRDAANLFFPVLVVARRIEATEAARALEADHE